MRAFFILLTLALSLNTFSQKNNTRLVLAKGQKFTVRTSSSQEADMGMGMEMKNSTTSQSSFYVIDADDTNYILSSTLTGLKIAMEVMGQQANYDSDLKADSASEIGRSIKNLNIPDTISINKSTAAMNPRKKDTANAKADGSSPMDALFESLGNSNVDAAITDAFFVIPAGKKVGDTWTDSTSTKEQKTLRTYTIKTIDKNIATIAEIGNVESTIQTETQGMQLTVTMITKTDSEVIVDTKTSLVSKRNTKADITGNLELMGQSAPISGKSVTTSVYEY